MVNEPRLLDFFSKLVAVDSLSYKEQDMARLLKNKLLELGLQAYEDEAYKTAGGNAGNVVGVLQGNQPETPAILLCAHMDTVCPGEGRKVVVKKGVIYSDQTTVLGADDQAGIAAIVEGLESVIESGIPHGDIEVVFTICEEVGLQGAKHLDVSRLNAQAAFVFDSHGPVGTVIVQAPAHETLDITITGKAAHAGINPEDGISAIEVAANAISRIKLGRIDSETTANIGAIEGGGATNIIPDEVIMRGETRSLDEAKLKKQIALIEQTFAQTCREYRVVHKFEHHREYSAFNLGIEDLPVKLAVSAIKELKLVPSLEPTGGGSDANVFNVRGIPAVNLGVGMEAVHTTREHIYIADLTKTAELVVSIIKQVAS